MDTEMTFLTVREVAQLLRVREHTVRQWIYLKRIPYLKLHGIKGRVLVRRDVIEQWLEEREIPTLEEIRHGR